MKILVVEDEPNNMMLMKIILKNNGHEPVEAFSGAQSVERISESRPDIVLMDLRLPDMEGFEATRRIREIMKDIPIIAVTSYSMDDVREEITKGGFNGLIQKPINPRTIIDDIRKILGQVVIGMKNKRMA